MDVFEKKILHSIQEQKLIPAGTLVIAGVSGGADSVCLLHVLCAVAEALQIRIHAVHIEHGLRGDASLEDAEFVRRLCREAGIGCTLIHADVKHLAQQGMSEEEAGREARYRAFEQVRDELGASVIAVAHHAGDQAETVLLNLCRGSGIRGLAGMRPKNGAVIRPLLFAGRREIEDYLRRNGRTWREDATNTSDRYSRNRIRSHVIPQLEQINDQAVFHLGETARRLRQAEEYLTGQAAGAEKRIVRYNDAGGLMACIPISLFLEEEVILQEYLIREIFRKLYRDGGLKDIGAAHVNGVRTLAFMKNGKAFSLPGGFAAWRYSDEIRIGVKSPDLPMKGQSFVMKPDEQLQMLAVPSYGPPELEGFLLKYHLLRELPSETIPENKYTKWLAYAKISCDICLRTRRPGDYLVVNRQGGRKKLKDYLIDEKVPRQVRDRIPVVAQGSHILWVIGYRISEAAKVPRSPAEGYSVMECMVEPLHTR